MPYANIEDLRARNHRYYQQHRKGLIAKQRNYQQRNLDEISAKRLECRRQNREKLSTKQCEYAVKNRDKINSYQRERYANDLVCRLGMNLRSRLWHAIRNGQKAGSAVKDLGCSVEEFTVYIASLFEPGMSWDNWGEWHLDHVKPLASFDLTQRDQFLAACHYTNLQPLWAADNLCKGSREES